MFWGGGSVALATSADNFHVLKCRPSERFEDGTVNFLDIAALRHGFALLSNMGGIRAIQVRALAGWGVAGPEARCAAACALRTPPPSSLSHAPPHNPSPPIQ